MSNDEKSLQEILISLRDTFFYLLRKWVTIAVVVIIAGIAGVTYAWLTKPDYIAKMSFVAEADGKGSFNAYASIAAQFGIGLSGGNNSLFEGDNLIELLKSRQLVMQTLLSPMSYGGDSATMIRFYLDKISGDPKSADFFTKAKNGDRAKDSIILDVADAIIKYNLKIDKRDKKVSIIDLEVKTTNELFSKRFAEVLAQNAIDYYTAYKISRTKQNVEILERQTDSIRRILYGNIGDVATMTDLNVNPAKQSVKTPIQQRQIEVQASGAMYVELMKNLELSRMTLRRETPLIQIVDKPILPLEKKGIGRLKTGLIFSFVGGLICLIGLLMTRKVSPNSKKNGINEKNL